MPETTENPPCEGAAGFSLLMRATARSRPPGGLQYVFCHGSGKFVSDSIDLEVWRTYDSEAGAEAPASL